MDTSTPNSPTSPTLAKSDTPQQPSVPQQPAQSIPPPQPQPVTPKAPPSVVAGSKEHAPIVGGGSIEASVLQSDGEEDDDKAQAVVIPHPAEVERSSEIQNAGVTPGTDAKMKISEELQQAGVKAEKEEVPHPTKPENTVKLPMDYTQAVQNRKKVRSFRHALRWLSEEIIFQWRKIKPELPK